MKKPSRGRTQFGSRSKSSEKGEKLPKGLKKTKFQKELEEFPPSAKKKK